MKIKFGVYFLCFAVLFMSGCAAQNQHSQNTTSTYYSECSQPFTDLEKSKKNIVTSTVVGSVAGAVIGGVIGGLLTKGDAKGIVGGALVGGVAGGSIGYAAAKQKSITDARARYASYGQDMDGEIANLDEATAAGMAAQACYEQSFMKLVDQYKAKQISKEEYIARYQEIRSGLQKTAQTLGQVCDASQKVEARFQAALTDESSKAGQPVPTVASEDVQKRRKAAPQRRSLNVQQLDKLRQDEHLASLNEQSLNAMAEGNSAYRVAANDAATTKTSAETQLQKMETVNASLTSGTL